MILQFLKMLFKKQKQECNRIVAKEVISSHQGRLETVSWKQEQFGISEVALT